MPIARWAILSRDGEAGWCGRRKHQIVSHRGSLYLLGGYTSAGILGVGNGPDANLNDVWKSAEGAAWVRLLERATWSGRDGHVALVHNGAIYLMGGTQDPRNNFNDVWRSYDGRDWVLVCRQANWRGRWQHAALSYQGHIYIIGGWTEGHGCLSDTWRSSDGVRWQRMCDDAPWGGRMFHSVIEANGAMYLLGGSNGREKLNDAWVSTDGREWSLVTHQSQWSPRAGHASICFEDALWVIGGDGNDGKLSDVWRSEDGAHWTQIEADVFPPRQGHAAVLHRGRVLVFGGVSEGTAFLNDCLMALSAEDIVRRGLRFSRSDRTPRDVLPPPSPAAPPSASSAAPPMSTLPTSALADGALALEGGVTSITERGGGSIHGSGNTGDSGTASGLDLAHSRRISRSFRHPSVEDELWGWFGDDRPPSDVGLVHSGGGGAMGSSSDLFFRIPSGVRGGRRNDGTFPPAPGRGEGESTDVSVSTTALTERLAKLSAGRALLDHVRAESRALAVLILSAARSAFAGGGDDCEGQLASPALADKISAEEKHSATTATAHTAVVTRSVSFCEAVATVMPMAEEEKNEETAVREGVDETEQESGGGGGRITVTTTPSSATEVVNVEQALLAPERIVRNPADSDHEDSGAGRDSPATQTIQTGVPDEQEDAMDEVLEVERTTVVERRSNGIRQGVVATRAQLEALQRDIRRLAREGDSAKVKVAPLVARRAIMAKAALPGAQGMAQRLREISDAQRSNHSNIVSAMREVEARARAARGQVWALIRDRRRQRASSGDEDDDDGSFSESESNDTVDPTGAPHDRNLGLNNRNTALAGGVNLDMPPPMPDPRNGNPASIGGAPEWVVSRLEMMRHRGSFIDGDELGPSRNSSASAAATGEARRSRGPGGEVVSVETVAGSFARLAQKAISEDAGGERRETNEALSALQTGMQEHAAALSRLAGWMANAVPTGSNGSQVFLTPESQNVAEQGSGTFVDAANTAAASAWFTPLAVAGSRSHTFDGTAATSTAAGLSSNGLPASESLAKTGFSSDGLFGDNKGGGALAAMQLSRELDLLEGRVRRDRFWAHGAADEEIHRTPGFYKEACALGNDLILSGHDYLSQVLSEAGRESSEASIRAEEASAWASRVAQLADGDALTAKAEALRQQITTIKNSIFEKEDAAIDCRSALEKKRRRMSPAGELEPLQAELAAAERGVRQAKRAGRRKAAEAAALAHGLAPEIALDLPEALDPFAGRLEEVQGVNVAGIPFPVRVLSDYENLRPMEDEGSTGGGQGRHRILLAEYDEETVVLKGYALVNALQRQSLERELGILSRIRHGAIIRATAIVRVRDDDMTDNPIPMIYIEFPYCSQGNLRHWLKAERRQPWELQAAFRQVMCAVMHLHDRGVIHKDIKPGNILVHADGRFLLADFDVSKDVLGGASGAPGEAGPGLGPRSSPSTISNSAGDSGGAIARAGTEKGGGGGPGDGGPVASGVSFSGGFMARGASEALTTRTSAAGTQGFMAPEVEAGRPSSLASDMYSLGAVLFHMHFPDHPTGPLPVGGGGTSGNAHGANGNGSGNGAAGGGTVGVPLVLPRATDPATTSLLKSLLAADPAERLTAPDALQADYFRVNHVERLQEDGSLLEQSRKLEVVRALFRSVRNDAKSAGPLKWTVKRDSRYLVPTVLELMKSDAKGPALRRSLKITFEGEAGVDEGGILSEMYTLLFEALMLPRFGLFEHSESPSASYSASANYSDPDNSSSVSTTRRRRKRDPTERAFAPRFRGLPVEADRVDGSRAGSGFVVGNGRRDGSGGGAGGRGGGGGRLDDALEAYGEHGAGLLDLGGYAGNSEVGDDHEEEQEEMDDGYGYDDDEVDDDRAFEAQREAQRLIIESAASGGPGGSGVEDGGRGKVGGAKFLPTARPDGYTDAQLSRYRAVGRAMVKCLFEGRRMGSRLAPSVFKFLTGTEPTLRDLQDYDPQTFDGLKWVLADPGVRDLGFHFEDVGQKEKGPVTESNKAEYVAAKARLILVGSREPALEALKGGFAGALRDLSPDAAPFMGFLSHADWRVLLCGEEHVSGPQVVAVLKWYNFPNRSEVPKWIRSLLLSLPEDSLRRFLIFVCGSPSLPVASAGKVEITVRCQPRSAALPAAHTCFFQLDVPDYDKESVLRHKLLQAVNNTASFDVV